MTKVQVRLLLTSTLLSFALVAGCSKDSSTDSGADTGLSTKDCGKGASCQGTYSTLSCSNKKWVGVCKVKQVDVGDWTKIWFEDEAGCGFNWIRAQGSVGSNWATLASGSATEAMVESEGIDVFQFRICTNGVNEGNTRCL